ncbi:MAG: MNIO family bufferin maturase [Kiloniellales bacterium]
MTAFAPLGRTGQVHSRLADPVPVTPIPAAAGIGLRHPHLPDFLSGRPPVAWLEVHSENFLAEGGPRRRALERIRRDYPLSCHGVGLSLGSAEGLSREHLTRLAALFDAVQPGLVSEHVAWSVDDGTYLNDLLPLPYTEEALSVLCRNIDQAQEVFGRRILIENPSSYLQFDASRMGEAEFLAETVKRSGCGLLLDVNNIVVSAENHDFDPFAYLEALPADAVGEIHVAGHAEVELEGHRLLIDDHGSRVPAAVWELLEAALARTGPVPVLMEWDTAIPDLTVLLDEAATAQAALDRLMTEGARHAG